MKVEVVTTRTYEMDEARVLREASFEPPPPDAPEAERRAWLRESFWELCGSERDADHLDGRYVWLVEDDTDVWYQWPPLGPEDV